MIHVTETPAFITAARKINTVPARVQLDGTASSPEFRNLATFFPEVEFVGNGVESIVLVFPGDEKKVISFSRYKYESARELKEKYYTHRILSILFPNNFPQIYAAGKLKDGSNVSVRERVNFTAEAEGQFSRSLRIQKRIQSTFTPQLVGSAFSQMEYISELLKNNGFPVSFESSWRGNLLKTKKGYSLYLDLVGFSDKAIQMPFDLFRDFLSNPECDALRGYPLSNQEKTQCENAFFRLKVMNKVISLIDDFIATNIPVSHKNLVTEATHIANTLMKEKIDLRMSSESLVNDIILLVTNDTDFNRYFTADVEGNFIPNPSD